MAQISFHVPYREVQEVLLEEGENVVKRIWQNRKDACLMAAGEVLEENGYLPYGTTYEPWGDSLWFSVDKGTNADLAHYFHEGIIYGPNFFIKKIGEWRSPKGKQKFAKGPMTKQGIKQPSGVAHWTEYLDPSKSRFNQGLYNQMVWRIANILEK